MFSAPGPFISFSPLSRNPKRSGRHHHGHFCSLRSRSPSPFHPRSPAFASCARWLRVALAVSCARSPGIFEEVVFNFSFPEAAVGLQIGTDFVLWLLQALVVAEGISVMHRGLRPRGRAEKLREALTGSGSNNRPRSKSSAVPLVGRRRNAELLGQPQDGENQAVAGGQLLPLVGNFEKDFQQNLDRVGCPDRSPPPRSDRAGPSDPAGSNR